jgi:hypothetical protein
MILKKHNRWWPRRIPVARQQRWDRVLRHYIYGDVFFWEVLWLGQTWYVVKSKRFPYPDLKKYVAVKRFRDYWYWKGTYK